MSKARYGGFARMGLLILVTYVSLAVGLIMTAVGIEGLMRNKRRSKNGGAKERSIAPLMIAAGFLLTVLAFTIFFTVNMCII